MAQSDSIDKIVKSYFAVVARQYKRKINPPKSLIVSPDIFRGFICPENCGGCCHSIFSLDYLPEENQPIGLKRRDIIFNGRRVLLYSDLQKERIGEFCSRLNLKNARCMIHGMHR